MKKFIIYLSPKGYMISHYNGAPAYKETWPSINAAVEFAKANNLNFEIA